MDIQQCFSIYDSKAQAYNQPFYAPSAGVAIRNFTAACNDESTEFNRFAGDFTLFHIGEFDCVTGAHIPFKQLINLGLALTFIEPTPSTAQLSVASK